MKYSTQDGYWNCRYIIHKIGTEFLDIVHNLDTVFVDILRNRNTAFVAIVSNFGIVHNLVNFVVDTNTAFIKEVAALFLLLYIEIRCIVFHELTVLA